VETFKVLVIDDEPGMRAGAERVLRKLTVPLPDQETEVGFEVSTAASGEEGLELIASAPPDILLLDHKLPGIQGLDLLDLVARDHGQVLTVMVTAYASIETAISATRRGAFDFLAKPFTPDELRSVVHKASKHLVLQRRADALAREKRQVRFQFISVLAHELKAPIAAVEGYVRLLQNGVIPPGTPGYDQAVARSLERLEGMRKLILDLLDLTRIESGQGRRELVQVDLKEAAQRAADAVFPFASARGIAIEVSAAPEAAMLADSAELDMLLNNLLTNAVKYNRDGGKVEVRVAREGGKALLSVSDTGIGMAPEDVARLFGEFVRIKNDQTRSIPGSGLGLSLVKKLATLYGGEVRVESVPGEGSTFTVSLEAEGGKTP
jgi:two-component system, sensor histidine kinase and response regulator